MRADGRSEISGERIAWPGSINFHHVLPKGMLRDAGLHEHVNDPRNGLLVTDSEHANHESGFRRIERRHLRRDTFELADELGPEWRAVLESHRYPESTEGGRSSGQ